MQYGNPSGGFLSRIPPIVKNLILINVVMLVATMLMGSFMNEHFALYYPGSPMFKPHQLFTHMFMHGDFAHLFFNMYALFIFGAVLEQYWGPKRFLTYYLVTGLGAAAFYLIVLWLRLRQVEATIDPSTLEQMKDYLQSNQLSTMREFFTNGKASIPNASQAMSDWFGITMIPMVGASGAIFGVLLAFGMMFPNVRLQLLFPPIAMRAKYFVMIYGALELYLGFAQLKGDNVAHFAHLGGMIFGFILIKYWQKRGGNRQVY